MLRAFSLFATLLLVGPASAYELVTLDGTVRETESVQFAGESCIVSAGESAEHLEAAQVDYYQTFRRNAESGAGNVIVFKTGAFFTFDTVEISKGRVILGLGDQGKVTVPEQVVDFEQSVKEAATIRLPRAGSRVDVAKKASGGEAGSARGGGRQATGDVAEARARGRSARSVGRPATGPRGEASSRASRRSASLRDVDGSDSESAPSSQVSDPFDDVEAESPDEQAESPTGAQDRDGMTDPEEVRRQAEERGEASGTVSVIISSNDSVDVAGVQFRLRYPLNCSPAGAQPIGAFANAQLSQPNGRVGGRHLLAMALVWGVGDMTSLPGQIARADFTWTGSEPAPGDFQIVSASASDVQGNPLRGFRAVAQVLN